MVDHDNRRIENILLPSAVIFLVWNNLDDRFVAPDGHGHFDF